jgi:hypothetical protein
VQDPLLNGLFGEGYTQGIQFNSADPDHLQAVVTLKHWGVSLVFQLQALP